MSALAPLDDPRHGYVEKVAMMPPAIAPIPAKPLILTSTEFVAGFTPPDYLLDNILQRRSLYSITAPTGTGKTAVALRIAAHVALGRSLAGRDVAQGKVLYFAGENPDDVRTRWIKLCEEMKIDPKDAHMFFVAGNMALSKVRPKINTEAKTHGPFALVIIDTFAAYFEGNDENSNTQMGDNARRLRSLVEVEGGPTVLVTCHPTKNAAPDNLLPRGGSAFLAEVDGNLVCLKRASGVIDMYWQGKFRGPDFAPISFKIEAGTTELLKDSRGRSIWTVTARPIAAQERDQFAEAARQRQSELLAVMRNQPGLSLAALAEALGWKNNQGEPNKGLVKRAMDGLAENGMVKKAAAGKCTLTAAGKRYAPHDNVVM